MGKALFVTGTGTDVGKTYVTGLIVKKLRTAGYRAGYYKAALSGAEPDAQGALVPGDVRRVQEAAGIPPGGPAAVSYVYREAVSPHLAALWNDRPIDPDRVRADFARAKDYYELLTMEGSGGIICPLRWDAEQKLILDDLIKMLGLGTLVVADAGLGTINAAVLTIAHLQRREIPVRGVILNNYHAGDPMEEDNRRMIEEITGVPVIAAAAPNTAELEIDAAQLAALYH